MDKDQPTFYSKHRKEILEKTNLKYAHMHEENPNAYLKKLENARINSALRYEKMKLENPELLKEKVRVKNERDRLKRKIAKE